MFRSFGMLALCFWILALATSARTEIMCSQHRGCWETGKRIFRTGGVMQHSMTIVNKRDGQKDSGKSIRIRCIGSAC
jgi:hypothetical protein